MQEARSGVLWYARGLETAACPAKLKDSGGRTPSNAMTTSMSSWRSTIAQSAAGTTAGRPVRLVRLRVHPAERRHLRLAPIAPVSGGPPPEQPRTLPEGWVRAEIRGFNDAFRLCPPEARARMTEEERRVWGLEAAVPPNSRFRGMTREQIEALTPEEKAVLNIAAF